MGPLFSPWQDGVAVRSAAVNSRLPTPKRKWRWFRIHDSRKIQQHELAAEMAGETIDEARTEEREEALPVPLPVAVTAGPYEAGRTAERNPFGLARVILTVDP